MKTLEEKQKIACEMVKNLTEENKKLKRKVANQRKQLKAYNRRDIEDARAIRAEEAKIKLEARKRKRQAKMLQVAN